MLSKKVFYLLFFFSGFSALIYEVVWARQLGLVFGNTTYAISTILTIFFGGLAVGSYLFGRIGDNANGKRIKILRMVANERTTVIVIYGLIELSIGIYAALTPLIFQLIQGLQISLSQQFNPTYSGFSLITFGLAFMGLIIPTVLMGGTLPVMSRFLATEEKKSGQVMGNLYGLNTLGGVAGVLLAGFYLIPAIGVRETVWLASSFSLIIGLIVLYLARRTHKSTQDSTLIHADSKRINTESVKISTHQLTILSVFFLTGFASLALEVLWTRVLILVFGSSTYAFTIILAVFLSGIAIGSFLASRFLLDRKSMIGWLVGLQLLLGLGVILATLFLPQLPFFFLDFYKKSASFNNNLWASFVISFLVILPLTTIMGMIFPLGIKLVTANFTTLAKDLGKLYSFNTIGGILGAFVAGFLLISLVGLQKGILLAAFLYLLAGVLLVFVFPFAQKIKISSVAACLVLFGFLFWLPDWDKKVLSSGVFVYSSKYLGDKDAKQAMTKDKLLYYKDGLSATVTVNENSQGRYLRINGKTDASNGDDLETVLLLGHLPMLLHPNPQKVLVVGLGSGITLGAVEQHTIEKVDLVEIEPVIIEAARYFDEAANYALDNRRLRVIIGDGRNFLLSTKNKYDVVSSEPSNLWVKGNANLFTKEYYELARERLEDDGIFLQWVQNYDLDKKDLKTMMATFHSVFPEMTVWSSSLPNDLMLIGTKKALRLDYDGFERNFKEEKVKRDLERVDITEAAQILGLFLLDKEGVQRLTKNGKQHTDNHPVLEYSTPFSLDKLTTGQVFEDILLYRKEPFSLIENITDSEREKITTSLKSTENTLKGVVAQDKGDFQEAVTYFSKVLEENPNQGQIKKLLALTYLDRSQSLYFQRNWAEAREVLLKATELNPALIQAHINLGSVYYQEGNVLEAASEWALAKELDPESPEVNKNLNLLDKYIQAE
ncbi:MAG: fused MFS/spermidine synthase [bacterium]|nr:fused MFS/spermidine synthase [bacterium]